MQTAVWLSATRVQLARSMYLLWPLRIYWSQDTQKIYQASSHPLTLRRQNLDRSPSCVKVHSSEKSFLAAAQFADVPQITLMFGSR